MRKYELEEGMIRYLFDGEPESQLGYNIIALLQGKEALLIDTGYENQAEEVLRDLDNNGFAIAGVIISHFHHDHIFGLKVLPKTQMYGSAEFQATFDRYFNADEQRCFAPTVLVKKRRRIVFGSHDIILIPFPGHSRCGILTDINRRYLHIGDELLLTNDGRPVLPSVGREDVKPHYEALGRLRKYFDRIFIPSHGRLVEDRDIKEREVRNRQTYLQTVLQHQEPIGFAEAVRDCDCVFLNDKWHFNIYK